MLRAFVLTLSLFALLLDVPLPIAAQADFLPDLEPITADNVSRLQPLAMLGVDLINDLAWSPDGENLLLAGSAGLWRYNVAQPESPPTLIEGYSGFFRTLSFHPDGTIFATGNDQGNIRLWDAETYTVINTLEANDSVEKLVFSPDGSLLAAGTATYGLFVWDSTTGKLVYNRPSPSGKTYRYDETIRDLVFSPNSILLLTANYRQIDLLNVHTNTEQVINTYSIESMAFNTDGSILAVGKMQIRGEGAGPIVPLELWDIETGTEIKNLFVYDGSFHKLIFSSSDTLIIGYEQDVLKLSLDELLAAPADQQFYPGDDQEKFADVNALAEHSIPGGNLLALSPDETTLAAVTNTAIRLIDVETGTEVESFALPYFESHDDFLVEAMAFSPNRPLLAHSIKGGIGLVNTETGLPEGSLLGHEAGVASIVFSQDGEWLVSGGAGRVFTMCYDACWGEQEAVRIWNLADGKQYAVLQGGYDYTSVSLLEISPDNRLIASASGKTYMGQFVQLWDWQAGSTLNSNDDTINFVVFSPRTPTAAVISNNEDSTISKITLWDTQHNVHVDFVELEGETLEVVMHL